MTTAREAALTAAAVKALQDGIRDARAVADAAVMAALDPGDRKNAVLPDGTKVGTVSVSNQGEPVWRVTDPDAFLRWVKEHRPTAIVEAVRSSDQKSILDAIPDTGELPDGVDLVDGKAPYVSVGKQTDEQRAAIAKAWADGTLEIPDLVRPAVES